VTDLPIRTIYLVSKHVGNGVDTWTTALHACEDETMAGLDALALDEAEGRDNEMDSVEFSVTPLTLKLKQAT